MRDAPLGSCCTTMQEVLALPNPLVRIEDNGVMYLAVGYMNTPQGGMGWFDQAPFFCPFCGAAIQKADAIREAAQGRPNKRS